MLYIDWIKAHEKLLLLILAGAMTLGLVGKIGGIIVKHDAATLTAAQATAASEASQNAALASQAVQQAAQYKALADRVDAQNAQLVQANATLVSALTKQQKADATMTPTDLVNRWNVLVPSANATTSPQGVLLPNAGALSTVDQLEEVPALRSELSNTTTQRDNLGKLLTVSTAQVSTLDQQVTGLNLQITDNQKVCTAQVTLVKAQARKSKLKWFGAGFVSGLTLGLWKP